MTVYILNIPHELQPERQPFRYPEYAKDWGVEQDFYAWLKNNPIEESSSGDATWHYLPAYWTRWHLNHNYGKEGREHLEELVKRCILNPEKTFTVCQYDDGPGVSIKGMKVALSSRKYLEGVDIPLLATKLPRSILPVRKRWKARFNGRLDTHKVRMEMAEVLQNRKDILIEQGSLKGATYTRSLMSSWVCLAPRGYGGSSFRFYEAMQVGSVPCLIGEYDTRPFKNMIDWASCSIYCSDVKHLQDILDLYSIEKLEYMAKCAYRIYWEKLSFGMWPVLFMDTVAALARD